MPARADPAPTYVGIVIAGHGSGCVKWHAGITGDAVLNAMAAVRYRNDGLIVQIDGQPASAHADATHYWSYWHDTHGSWVYSGAGASASQPAAGTVEGWAFVNGRSQPSPPARSAGGLYRALCGSRDPRPSTSHPAAPAPQPTKAPTTARPPAHHRSRPAVAVAPPRSTTASTIVRTSTSRPSATDTRHTTTANPPRTTTADGTPGVAAPVYAAAPTSADTTPTAAKKDSSGALWPVLLALALAGSLGAAAGWTVLRRRRTAS
ncbi:MAG TPA: hypothetical protein VFU35_06680 [Jatrophihabitans sp.]|nr:hypothetical protein [Jatrophihabitans sp.]